MQAADEDYVADRTKLAAGVHLGQGFCRDGGWEFRNGNQIRS
jgi:hypothetical protein